MARRKLKSPLTSELAFRRRQAARLLSAGKLSKAQIAHHLGVSRAAVTQWARMMKEGGPKALYGWERPGRPPRLSDADWRRVLKMLGRGPKAVGFSTDRWTLKLVRQLIEHEFGANYSLSYLAEKLRALRWATPISATRRVKQNERQAIRRPDEEGVGRAIGRAIRRSYSL